MEKRRLISVILAVIYLFSSGCAYKLGYSEKKLPKGFTLVNIPVFENLTQEVGIETYFTNALREEFARSPSIRVVGSGEARVRLEGYIEEVRVDSSAETSGRRDFSNPSEVPTSEEVVGLPRGAVLTTEYRMRVRAAIRLRQLSDRKVIWYGKFVDEKVYAAPQIGSLIVNSANALYNHSARHQNIDLLARDMMAEAYRRITENF